MSDLRPPDASDQWVAAPPWAGWAPPPSPPPKAPRNPTPFVVGGGLLAIVALAVGLVLLGGDGAPGLSDDDARSASAAAPAADTAADEGATSTTAPAFATEEVIPGGEVPEDAAGPQFDDDGLPTATRELFIANLERTYEPEMAACIADELFAQTEQETLDRLAGLPFAELTSLERAIANNAFLACARSVWGMPDG